MRFFGGVQIKTTTTGPNYFFMFVSGSSLFSNRYDFASCFSFITTLYLIKIMESLQKFKKILVSNCFQRSLMIVLSSAVRPISAFTFWILLMTDNQLIGKQMPFEMWSAGNWK
jgi:hypothetical protein